MRLSDQSLWISTTCGELNARDNMPPAPESLRRHFAIPMHSPVRQITSHTSSSMSHVLLGEEKGEQ